MRRVTAAMLLSAIPLAAIAQAPAAPGNVPGQVVPVSTEASKSGAASPQPVQRSSSKRPGGAPAPMHIRIQEEGIKLPKCTAESREGEACKK